MRYRIPYGKGELEFEIPLRMNVKVIESKRVEAIQDLENSTYLALKEPIFSESLKDLASKAETVCIVFTDLTRSCPDHVFIKALIEELLKAGIKEKDIVLLCGTGMHRSLTLEEKRLKLGRDIADRFRCLDHYPLDQGKLKWLGYTDQNIPIFINKTAVDADLLISTGIVEPHQYAGYSGGRKSITIGVGGAETIRHTHSPALLDHPNTRLGSINGNPFHHAITEGARRAGLNFILNSVNDAEGRPVKIMAGHWQSCYLELVQFAKAIYETPLSGQYDVVIAGVGYPKDINLYQASRAASYIFFAPRCPLKEDGIIILPAQCPEGVGKGVGEQNFFKILKSEKDMSRLIQRLKSEKYPPGAQRAFIMAKVLEKTKIILISDMDPEIIKALHMLYASDISKALQMASHLLNKRSLDILILPHSMLTLTC